MKITLKVLLGFFIIAGSYSAFNHLVSNAQETRPPAAENIKLHQVNLHQVKLHQDTTKADIFSASRVSARDNNLPDNELPDNDTDYHRTITTEYSSADETAGTSSTIVDNPHLPVAYQEEPLSNEAEEDEGNTITSFALEEGQSRTFHSLAVQDDSPAVDETDDNNDGYFLQPGQSRTFSSIPATDQQLNDTGEE